MRTSKILSISLPPKMFLDLKKTAKKEEKTQSELLREALRRYLDWREFKNLQKDASTKARALDIRNEKDVEMLIDEVRQ